MAWLPVARNHLQSSALRLAKNASNGFTQSRFISSTQASDASSSLIDSTVNSSFNPWRIALSLKSFERGLQGVMNNNSCRWITTVSQIRFGPADSSTVVTDRKTSSEADNRDDGKSEADTIKKGKNSRFPDGVRCLAGLEPTKPGEKARIVVLGTGWAGCRLMKGLDTNTYDVVCISPRNHMVFTPLLASTCVGTLELRSVAEPVSRIQPALSKSPNSYFLLAQCRDIDPDTHESGVRLVRGIVKDVQSQKIVLNDGTEVPYGLLVWSTGVGPSSFISSLKLSKSPGGRIGVDDWLRVPSAEDVYAIGDCCGFLESTKRPTLPAYI